MVRIGDAQRQSGDPASRETLLEAATLARRLGATSALVAAVLASSRGVYSTTGLVDQEQLALIEAALEAAGTGRDG